MKLSLNGLIGYLQGKGWKIKMNADDEDEEVFEVEDDDTEDEEEEATKKVKKNSEASTEEDILSVEELLAVKNLARVLAKNGKLIEAIEAGTLDAALSAVPAAAQLVQNAQAREKAEKEQVIAQIRLNNSNTFTDEELLAMPVPALVKLNAQMNVSYAGLGGSYISQNEEQPLRIRPALLAQAEEAKNG
jgi:hypothetical protein